MDQPSESVNSDVKSSMKTDFTKCIICQSDQNGYVHKLTTTGIKTLVDVILKRQDKVSIRLCDDNALFSKAPFWHQSCRVGFIYTNQSQEQNIPSPANSRDVKELTNDAKRQKLDFNTCCFLCDRIRDAKGLRHVSLVTTVDRQKTIYEKAKQLNDDYVLAKLRGHEGDCIDMNASGFRYHKSCMTHFMCRQLPTGSSAVQGNYDDCFETLVEELSRDLVTCTAHCLNQLRDRYRQLLAQRGISDGITYKSNNLAERLKNRFGSQIQIIPQSGKSSLVCSSHMTVQQMCSEILRLKKELDESQLLSDTSDGEEDSYLDTHSVSTASYSMAKWLRVGIKEKASEQRKGNTHCNEGHPELVVSHEAASAIIPDALFNHIAWLITDVDLPVEIEGRVQLSEKLREKVINLSQDVMAASVSINLPKHVGLGLHIMKQTKSKELLTVLNRFGNTISYNDAQRYITTEANLVEKQEQLDGIYVPDNLSVGSFTHYAFDNLDFSESTADGNTLHATTHNIYQYTDTENDKAVPRTVPLVKGRDVTIENKADFVSSASSVTLKDRRDARNIQGVPLVNNRMDDAPSALEDDTFVWQLTRMLPTELMVSDKVECSTLSWNQYFEGIHESSRKTNIAYGPLFPSSPTNPGVVEASLDYFMRLSTKLKQKHTVVTCDQAIYDIAKGLQSKKHEHYSSLILRMGGFHIAENFLGAIGFFMKGSGLEDILVMSKTCGAGTANKVVSGKDYYKMVRYHSLVSEAITRMKWKGFEDYLVNEGLTDKTSILLDEADAVIRSFEQNDKTITHTKVTDAKKALGTLSGNWKEYENTLGPTTHFWSMYLEMVAVLHRYIRAERCSSWKDHITEVQNMLPYIVAAGHTKYAACLPLYLRDMKSLPVEAPEVYHQFEIGNFTVQRKNGPFNGIWSDMALEQTYNKDGKTTLLKGITQSAETRDKYIKTVPFLTSVSESVKDMTHILSKESSHHGESNITNNGSETQVMRIIDTIVTSMIDPFTTQDTRDLVNIATGETAQSSDILTAKDKAIEALQQAEVNNSTIIVHPKLITFAKRSNTKQQIGKQITGIYREEIQVTRSLCFVRDSSEESKRQCFSHEWTEYPSSLFEPYSRITQGYLMRKGNKHDYFKVLKSAVDGTDTTVKMLPVTDVPTAYFVDAMAFIHRIQTGGATKFGELPKVYLTKLLSMMPKGCTCIHFVGDRYDVPLNESLKCDERLRRNQSMIRPEYKPSDNLDIPDWKQFLQNTSNKQNLLHYLAISWCDMADELPEGILLFLGGVFKDKTKTVRLSSLDNHVVSELSCVDHEEADTRLMVHLEYTNTSQLEYERSVIYATDTDVTILAMYHAPRFTNFKELWVEANGEYIDIQCIVHALATTCQMSSTCTMETLLSCYVLSGCDTVSFPYRRGKRHAAKVAISMVGKLPNLGQFGKPDCEMAQTNEIVSECRLFFVSLYGRQDFASLDVLRAHLFAASKTDIRALPPTEDAFALHVYRALYQIAIYKRAHLGEMHLPKADTFGRTVVDGKLIPVLMHKTSRPKVVAATSCKCKTSRCLKSCSCVKASVQCVIACLCGKCGRVQQQEADPMSD